MLTIIAWVIFGAVAGFIADLLDSSVRLTWLERIVVGVVGAFVGGTLYTLLTAGSFDLTASASFDIVSLIVAVVGALISLFVWKKFRGTRAAV